MLADGRLYSSTSNASVARGAGHVQFTGGGCGGSRSNAVIDAPL
jgi:hypothetical protein